MEKCQFCHEEYSGSYGDHIQEKHPISCEEVKSKFNDYANGRLDDETDERVICHLAGCKSCMDALNKFNEKQIQAALQ